MVSAIFRLAVQHDMYICCKPRTRIIPSTFEYYYHPSGASKSWVVGCHLAKFDLLARALMVSSEIYSPGSTRESSRGHLFTSLARADTMQKHAKGSTGFTTSLRVAFGLTA